jgi:phosphoserine phosphatase
MKLVVFDFDSTLMDGETIEFLASELGFEDEVALITQEAMNGKLDFFQSLQERVALLKGLPTIRVKEICQSLPLTYGARETVSELKRRGYKVVCFSGGFRDATKYFADILELDADFANILHSENGILSGKVGGEMMFGDSKGMMIRRVQSLLGIDYKDTVVVGDGANDLSMFFHSSIRIAFCAKEILKRASTHTIDEKNLTKVIDILDSLES